MKNAGNQRPEQPAKTDMPQYCANKQAKTVNKTQIPLADTEAQINTEPKQNGQKKGVPEVDGPRSPRVEKIVAHPQTYTQQAGAAEPGKQKRRRGHLNSLPQSLPLRGSS